VRIHEIKVQSLSLIFRNRKSVYIYRRPASQEGRFAVVTNVDAGRDGRGCAFDEWR
jgi:hypothetical protein